MIRATLLLLGAGSIVIAPVWVTILIAFLLAFRWEAWEVIVLGVMVDALWLPSGSFWGVPLATVSALILVWLLAPIRNELLTWN
jgi:hypothetical protein